MSEVIENINFTRDIAGHIGSEGLSEVMLSNLSIQDLETLVPMAATALESRREIERQKDIATLNSLADRYGVKLVWPTERTKRSRAASLAKFVDPSNAKNAWSGRGRKPQWLKDYEAAGHKVSDFMVG